MQFEKAIDPIKSIFKVNLDVKKRERVLVFTDEPNPKERLLPKDAKRRKATGNLACLCACIARGLAGEAVFFTYPATGASGIEPPEGLWRLAFGDKAVDEFVRKGIFKPLLSKSAEDAILNAAGAIISKNKKHAVDVVVALSNYSTTHTIFRRLLTAHAGTRFASMPLFDTDMLEGSMSADWSEVEIRTKRISGMFKGASMVSIATHDGTDISFSVRGRKVHEDTGLYTKTGSCGNLPAGEVFMAPVEGSAHGRMVLNWAPTRKLKSPVTVSVRDGRAVEVKGKDNYADELNKRLSLHKDNSNIAELGIGTNDRAHRPDNILESEKILGTVHIALGDNSNFGGNVKAPYHQDFVFFRPTLVITRTDGSQIVLIKDGRHKR